MPNEIDTIMDLDPLDMTSKDIDAVITYHRNNRARENAQGKMEKPKGAKVSVDLTSLIQGMTTKGGEAPKPAAPKTGGGIRRV